MGVTVKMKKNFAVTLVKPFYVTTWLFLIYIIKTMKRAQDAEVIFYLVNISLNF